MLHKLATACLILVLMLVTVSLAQPAQAQPPALPHQFYGTVTIGGNPAPAGTNIVAQINSVTYASTSVDSQGKYGYSPIFLIPADNADTPTKDGGVNGDTIRFFVGGTTAQTYVFASGGITKLDLSISSGGGGGTPPSAPTLSSPASSATGVSAAPDLQWSASSGATSYQAQVSITSNFSSTIFNQSGISTTHVTVSPALNASTTYYWRVNASNSSGNSSWSAVRSFTTAAGSSTPPSAPTLSSPANSATGVSTTPDLQWNTSSGATSYQAQVSTTSNFSSAVFNQAGISITHVTVSPALNADTTYYWRVNASNSAGTSDWSAVSSFTTTSGTTTPPSPPPPPPAGGTSISTSILGHSGSISLGGSGVLQTATTLSSADGALQLSINANTTVNIQGQSLTVSAEASPPAAPANNKLVNAYNFGPNDTTFNPPLTLTLKYDAASLPQNVTESNLYVAYWTGSLWSGLSSVVDTQNKIVTAQVGHFTVFALLGTVGTAAPPKPASFAVSDLKVTPTSIKTGEQVTITATVTNNGGSQGSYKAVLEINGADEAEKELTLDPQQAKEVTFTVSKNTAGNYSVAIGNQSGSFAVSSQTPAQTTSKSPFSSVGIIALALGGLLVIILIIIIARKLAS